MERRNGSTEYHGEARIPATASGPDPARVEAARKPVRDYRNLLLAAAVGTGAALLGAVLWTAVADLDFVYTGWIALLTAFLVGRSVHYFAKEDDRAFGFLGAGLSFFGCLLGFLVCNEKYISWIPRFIPSTWGGLLVPNPDKTLFTLSKDFSVLGFSVGLLVCGLAAYLGYRFAFRRGEKKTKPFLARGIDRIMERRKESTDYHGEARSSAADGAADPVQPAARRKPARDSRNLLLAAAVGMGAALLGAGLSAVTDEEGFLYPVGIALLTAFLVGRSVHYFAKEGDRAFGFLAAGLSFFGCLLGDLGGILLMIARGLRHVQLGMPSTLKELIRDPGLTCRLLAGKLSISDLLPGLLFYSYMAYLAYRFAFRRADGKSASFFERRMDKVAAFSYILMLLLGAACFLSMFMADYCTISGCGRFR